MSEVPSGRFSECTLAATPAALPRFSPATIISPKGWPFYARLLFNYSVELWKAKALGIHKCLGANRARSMVFCGSNLGETNRKQENWNLVVQHLKSHSSAIDPICYFAFSLDIDYRMGPPFDSVQLS